MCVNLPSPPHDLLHEISLAMFGIGLTLHRRSLIVLLDCTGSVGILVSSLPPSARTVSLANTLTNRYGHRVVLLRYPSAASPSSVNAFIAALEVMLLI